MSDEAVKEIEGLLEAELAKEQRTNRLTLRVGGGMVAFVAVYVSWVSVMVARMLDPAGLAEAATGFAIGAVPEAGAQVRTLVVDGAPDLVRMGSHQILEMIPDYRLALQQELDPVLDETCRVLAQAAVQELAERAGNPSATYATSEALQAGADAAVARVDAVLAEAMDKPDDDGVTPRQHIESSLGQLKRIDKELAILAKKKGHAPEREMLLAWLNVLGQHEEAEEAALKDDYKMQAAEAKKKPGDAGPAPAGKADAAGATAPAAAGGAPAR